MAPTAPLDRNRTWYDPAATLCSAPNLMEVELYEMLATWLPRLSPIQSPGNGQGLGAAVREGRQHGQRALGAS
jgi:hypothetical protein